MSEEFAGLRKSAASALARSEEIGEETWYTEGEFHDSIGTPFNKPDSAFLAAATPAAIMALLDRLQLAEADVIRMDMIEGDGSMEWMGDCVYVNGETYHCATARAGIDMALKEIANPIDPEL